MMTEVSGDFEFPVSSFPSSPAAEVCSAYRREALRASKDTVAAFSNSIFGKKVSCRVLHKRSFVSSVNLCVTPSVAVAVSRIVRSSAPATKQARRRASVKSPFSWSFGVSVSPALFAEGREEKPLLRDTNICRSTIASLCRIGIFENAFAAPSADAFFSASFAFNSSRACIFW